MVSVLAFYSDGPSSNPAEAYSFSLILCLKRMKINKKRPGLAHLKKTFHLHDLLFAVTNMDDIFNFRKKYCYFKWLPFIPEIENSLSFIRALVCSNGGKKSGIFVLNEGKSRLSM